LPSLFPITILFPALIMIKALDASFLMPPYP